MKLNPFENSRIFYSRNGNQKVVRDTFVNQKTTTPEKIEPKIEVKMSGEPTLDILAEEKPAPKTPKKKNERLSEN